MKTINVVAALIVNNRRIFAMQRGYGEWQGWWEFSGGKMDSGGEHWFHTPEQMAFLDGWIQRKSCKSQKYAYLRK